MMKYNFQSGKQCLRHFFICLACISLTACVGEPIQPKSQDVSIAPIGKGGEATQTNIKRGQIATELMRYADRYAGRMSLEADKIKNQAPSPDMRWFASGWNLMSQKTVLDISIGPNAVENLLDMLVFASLTRLEVENYWVPDYLGPELGAGLLQSSRLLEKDIWDLSGKVLTPEQQQNLRDLIQEWRKANPGQHFFWSVRFSGFSSQQARDLQEVQQTGGLLAEVQRTRETAEEIQDFSERLLHYLQRAPGITRLEAEFGMREALRTPEISQMMEDVHRMSVSSARYAAFAENLTAETRTLMDEMFVKLARERETIIDDVSSRQLEVIRQLLASKELENAIDRISQEGDEIANVTFIRGALLILLWAIAYIAVKLGYDYFKQRAEKSPRA
ncbi:MAG: hypothetical protein PVG13_07785 [Thiohalophilus sp.]|jgi:hypothetical protein